ncbi:Chondroitin synthase [Marinomonas gallaica]|uniref:Chondroitin synthase n=1 Tax=Marinomonas gallaica TaxID=1806667 RepID=A0A1C3JUZ8_9GAMM|nr:glycosyltransferase family 2 protein [Marinomonas gallaica]SBT18945.1 Chondroitin synthase [Marinomonas gallaica]SBT21900.1 Chondroitin synthase [Marinomonas gallaica]
MNSKLKSTCDSETVPAQADPLKYSFQDLSLGIFQGWCDKATHARLIVEGRILADDLKVNALYKGQTEVEDSACAFRYTLDASTLKSYWFKKSVLSGEVVFFNEQTQIVAHTINIDSRKLLNSVKNYNQVPLTDIGQVILESQLWDEAYYLQQVPAHEILHESKVIDYIIKSVYTGRSPCEQFNSQYYAAKNPDVIQSNVNPFYHYLMCGEKEGRRPSAYFNPKLYLDYNPDLSNWDLSLLAHLVLTGLNEGRVHNEFIKIQQADAAIDPYLAWRLNNEPIPYSEVVENLQGFKNNPIISIVVPVYNPPIEFLIRCIESVKSQSYPHWELCLADDKSPNAEVRKILKKYAKLDRRIKVKNRRSNGHISAASNSALELVTGEWVALLDHDDELHEHALYHVVNVLNEQPKTQFIYSDEDKITEDNQRFEPHFKSDWNLDLLYSQNYISHLGVYRADIVKQIGGFREGVEGSQDYDLLLRYSREIDHSHIVHIPKVLYHWRVIDGSTAMAADGKTYTTDAGIKALEDHFKELGQSVSVEQGKHANIYKVNWDITDEPLVSLIIPTYNGQDITKQAIDSILGKTIYQNYEIILVDNNSDDPEALAYFDEIGAHPKVTLLKYPFPFNYSAINNFAVSHAKGSIVGLINNDIEVINPEWLTEMVSHANRDDIGCVGAMLYYSNDTIQHAGVILGIGGVAGHSHKYFERNVNGYFSRLKVVQNLSAVTAACLLVRKEIFESVNGLNETDLKIAFNDVDFCLKVQKAGYRNLWTPYAELYHYESISRGAEDNPEKVARFNKEVDYMINNWDETLKKDLYYNENLTIEKEDFSYV